MVATVRRLQGSDRDDVIEISSHIWEGHDYLPSVVDEWLRDSNSRFYGVEVDGRVVAVGRIRLVEDGRIGWMEGLRVHPEYRGRGFANDLTETILREGERLGVERLRYTTSDENAASVKLAKMAGFSRILRMTVSWYHNLKQIPTSTEYPPIRKFGLERTYGLLETNPHILPQGMLIYEWKALDNTSSNVKEVGKNHSFYVALKRGRLDSLSISPSGKEPDESYWGFTAYAVDSSGFLAQFSRNVTLALKRGLGSIACTFETRFEKALDGVGLRSEEDHQTHLILLEKRMRRRKRKG
ncbi:MAG: GNAT family N-acetyltransferase [Candidatus Bathyarchaeia archaeon]|jgi:RimJ/RimL family protein N-acetyltransferase